jgi:N-acyl-D-amino-acid deacylase
MGNCGVGFAPCRTDEASREFLLNLVEAVEDIPNEAMSVGIDWAWESFPEYLDKLDTLNLACDVAVLITHCPVRAYAIGTRAALSDLPGGPENDEITKEDIDTMADIVEEAVAAGACGFSTSRIILHRDNSGNLTPGSLAQEAEMLALGRAIAAGGGGVFEGAFDFSSYDDVPVLDRDPAKQKIHMEREW